jgi:hypothetical protein
VVAGEPIVIVPCCDAPAARLKVVDGANEAVQPVGSELALTTTVSVAAVLLVSVAVNWEKLLGASVTERLVGFQVKSVACCGGAAWRPCDPAPRTRSMVTNDSTRFR